MVGIAIYVARIAGILLTVKKTVLIVYCHPSPVASTLDVTSTMANVLAQLVLVVLIVWNQYVGLWQMGKTDRCEMTVRVNAKRAGLG